MEPQKRPPMEKISADRMTITVRDGESRLEPYDSVKFANLINHNAVLLNRTLPTTESPMSLYINSLQTRGSSGELARFLNTGAEFAYQLGRTVLLLKSKRLPVTFPNYTYFESLFNNLKMNENNPNFDFDDKVLVYARQFANAVSRAVTANKDMALRNSISYSVPPRTRA